MTMKLSDYVAQKVVELGIHQVFMITGGGAMHLNQSLGNHPSLHCLFNHHEQASAMAAESYYRLTNRPAVVNVTSGPGGTNTITGVYGAWTDSLAVLVISGQVKYPTTVRSSGLPLRQLGDQEIDIQRLVEPITKYCVMVTDPQSIRYHLEKAYHLAVSGRPGPVWIDIPIDIQAARVELDRLIGFDPEELTPTTASTALEVVADDILARVMTAKRPLLLAGSGIRLSGAHNEFLQLVERLGIPVVTAWNAHDTLWTDHPYYIGRPGTVGDRAGNFAVQSADLLLVLGSRLNIRQISYNWESFARKAYKIWVDIDPLELQKPTVQPDMPVVADLKMLLPLLADRHSGSPADSHRSWLAWCQARKARYPVVSPEQCNGERINPYCFMNTLFHALPEDEIVVAANGSACVVGFQAAYLKPGQRLWSNSGCAAMGYDLPAAIGACLGNHGKRVICLAGDGSIMMNLQELTTIVGANLPIKIFLLNNGGYVSIRQTHTHFFGGREIGTGPESGVSLPNFERLCAGFNLPYQRVNNYGDMVAAIKATLQQQGPTLCEIVLDHTHVFEPKLASRQLANGTMLSPSLEDMAPHLSNEELMSNRIE
ncbi:MAG: thiamine pyrophosphate-binding protein [Lamprobacter sp.]|uniref:thiamine pyrophosphate-binding protein n=1 Tax=Lamprobacter sp. TaxID=3100796 RepID=UPI002B25A121|nr:thiamine pyrophosphate-binding protein [Lamprobacter sp.]MEA3641489.1 thiamine pyrophosphate-binding protein [Lamprobacter sp.]